VPPEHPVKRVRQSLKGFAAGELNKLSKAENFAQWIGRSGSLLRNVEHRAVPLSANLARRISERTGVSAEWLLSDPPAGSPIPAVDGGIWDPLRLLDPLVLGDYDFRNTLPMAPQLLLQLALAILEAGCSQALAKGDNTPLVNVMDLIKRNVDLHDEETIAAINERLRPPGCADALQLWVVARLAAKHRRVRDKAQGGDDA